MRATIVFSGTEGKAAAVLMAGEPGMPAGLVSFSLRVGDRLEAVFMPPHEAALLAGEIERAAWAAQREDQARRDRCIPSGLADGEAIEIREGESRIVKLREFGDSPFDRVVLR
jgi:hypothetical protein